MISVEIRSFQSIEHLEIEIDQFTAIVGRSNIGKSAVVRAIKSCLTNAVGTAFVRHGPTCARKLKSVRTCKCSSSVRLKTKDLDLLWEKGDSVNRYVVNGSIYEAIERGIPEFLTQSGFGIIKIWDRAESLQIADQFNPIFLLDQSGGVAADVISDVARLDAINEAMKLCERDRKEVVATKKVREQDVVNLSASLAEYDGLDPMLGATELLPEALSSLALKESQCKFLDEALLAHETLTSTIDHLGSVQDIRVPECTSLLETSTSLSKLTAYIGQLNQRELAVNELNGIERTPKAPSIDPLLESLSVGSLLSGWVDKLRAAKEALQAEKSLTKLPSPDIGGLSVVETKYSDLQKFCRDLLTHQARIELLGKDLQQTSTELEGVETEIDDLGGICPTCSGALR